MKLRVKTSVIDEPLDIDFVKNYIKYDGSMGDEIALIQMLIRTSRKICEKFLNRAFAKQTLVVTFDKWDMDNNLFELPYSPHSRIVSLKSKNEEGEETTLTLNDDYFVRGDDVLELNIFKSLGTSSFLRSNTNVSDDLIFICEYVCGYDISLEDGEAELETEEIPEELKLAMLKQITEWYDNRESWQPTIDASIKELLMPYNRNTFNVGK